MHQTIDDLSLYLSNLMSETYPLILIFLLDLIVKAWNMVAKLYGLENYSLGRGISLMWIILKQGLTGWSHRVSTYPPWPNILNLHVSNKCLTPIFLLNQYQSRCNFLYSQVCINPDTTSLYSSVSINPDATSLYSSVSINPDTTSLYSSVSINPDTTSVFVSIYQSRYNSL